MLAEIEASLFGFGIDTKTDKGVNDLQDNKRPDQSKCGCDGDGKRLRDETRGMAVKQPFGPDGREQAGRKYPEDAADAMDAHNVKRVIIAEATFPDNSHIVRRASTNPAP